MACVFLRLILQGLLSTNIGDSITQAFIFGLVRCTHCFAHSFKNSIKRTTFWDEDVETPLKWPYISSNSSFLLKGFYRKGFLIPFFLIISIHRCTPAWSSLNVSSSETETSAPVSSSSSPVSNISLPPTSSFLSSSFLSFATNAWVQQYHNKERKPSVIDSCKNYVFRNNWLIREIREIWKSNRKLFF